MIGATNQRMPSSSPPLGELDLHLIGEGLHGQIADRLGAHATTMEGRAGVRFALWAPNARCVSVVGDFNYWDGSRHPMRRLNDSGVWELFIPDAAPGACYKFQLYGPHGQLLPLKADPYARQTERPPATASVVASPDAFHWTDEIWMTSRATRQAADASMTLYEAHLGSWMRTGEEEGSVWQAVGDRLIGYVAGMGFTHLELLPITEHPFAGSWGYQPLGMFAPSARYGTPAQFAAFVNRCHGAGLGLILDWVPAHFPSDAHGLAWFDGTALYEHADPRQGFHPDWNTLIYNLGRNEVRNFLMASAMEWLHRYHVDGLRVDAVASMLYLDYSREPGQWVPNPYGGRENLDAVQFLRDLNSLVRRACPGAIMIAEESTAWPGVTAPVEEGGLGFDYKWNMGWMHDTLGYMQREPVHRRHHHSDMTFGMMYAYSERFILPLSHDEVVHGKQSLLGKMPGDAWQRFANLRAYLGYMWGHPGKKLLFMGDEIAQWPEWDHDGEIDWACLRAAALDLAGDEAHGKAPGGFLRRPPTTQENLHVGMQRLVKDLNTLYSAAPAMHRTDAIPEGFDWVIGDDAANSVFAFLRSGHGQHVLVVSNMTPVPRHAYQIGVPCAGWWREALNTDAHHYGGSNMGNGGGALTEATAAHGHAQSLSVRLPPLATLVFIAEG